MIPWYDGLEWPCKNLVLWERETQVYWKFFLFFSLRNFQIFACRLNEKCQVDFGMAARWAILHWDLCKVHSEILLVSHYTVIQNFAAGVFQVKKKFDKKRHCVVIMYLRICWKGACYEVFSNWCLVWEEKNTDYCDSFREWLSPASLNMVCCIGRCLYKAMPFAVTHLQAVCYPHAGCVTDRVCISSWLLSLTLLLIWSFSCLSLWKRAMPKTSFCWKITNTW